MDLKKRYYIEKDICIADYKDNLVCMHTQERVIFVLNRSAREVFGLLRKGQPLRKIESHLMQKFDLPDLLQARKEIRSFIKDAQKKKLIKRTK